MPVSVPMSTKNAGDVLTSALWNSQLRDNINKLLNLGHRTLTVAQFAALAAPEGTKGVVAGDEVYLEVDATNGVLWHLVYESGEATYKWRFLGGPPLVSEVTTDETTASTTYAALATAGPSVALPKGGDYDVKHEFMGYNTAASETRMSYDIGGTGAVDADVAILQQNGLFTYAGRQRRKTALGAVTLTAKYRVVANTGHFINRFMAVTPVRITN